MSSSKDSSASRSTREIISDAESTLQDLKKYDINNPNTVQKFSHIDRLIIEIESVPGSKLYKTLIDQLRTYSSLLQKNNRSRPQEKLGMPNLVNKPLETIQPKIFTLTQNESINFYHTYQKQGFTGEYTTCNGASETISQTDLLSLIQKENMKIMNRTIDLNHLSFDVGFSPPFNGGGGIFIIRFDRGLDRANRPSNFEYWYFSVEEESDKLSFLHLIQKTYEHVYSKPNSYLNFTANKKPNLELLGRLFTPEKHFFNSEKQYWATVREICTLIQRVQISWLSTRVWFWLSDGHHSSQRSGLTSPKNENLSPSLDLKQLMELVTTKFDISFGDHETITGASHNLNLHNRICDVFNDPLNLLQFYRNMNHLDSFIDAIIRTNPHASIDNLAFLLMFNYFELLSMKETEIVRLREFIEKEPSFSWQKFFPKHLSQILELAQDNSIGYSGLKSLSELTNVKSDQNIEFLLNHSCWNPEVVNWLEERKILNNIDEIISGKTNRIESINESLITLNVELKSSEKIFLEYQELKKRKGIFHEDCKRLRNEISEIEMKFQAFRKTPDLLATIKKFSTELDKPTRKEIKRIKPPSSLIGKMIRRGSKVQQKNKSSELRSFFYLHYWNYLKKINAGEQLTVCNNSYKKTRLELEQINKQIKDYGTSHPNLDVKLTKLREQCKTLIEEKSSLEKDLKRLDIKKKHHQN